MGSTRPPASAQRSRRDPSPVRQGHTTQADWTPDKVPALFKVHRTPEMTAWVAGITVAAGERFTFGGATWECVQAHTTQKGWEPDRVPSLWRKV